MNDRTLEESLSALMDGETDIVELHRVLVATQTDLALRDKWARYQTARAAMHRRLDLSGSDISMKVAAEIGRDRSLRKIDSVWRHLGKTAIAASVAIAVLSFVRFYHGGADIDAAGKQSVQPELALIEQEPSAPVFLTGYRNSEAASVFDAQDSTGWYRQRLPFYLRQHAQQVTLMSGDRSLPYARAASVDGAAKE